ncbi:MAG: permease [Candidatus Peribacteraceae bacterium]|nr:permease [Candidatus Peribacteraceae bacterium]
MKSEQSFMGMRFFVIVVLGYIVVAFFRFSTIVSALYIAVSLLVKILPVMGYVFFMMVLINLFISPEIVIKYVGKSSGSKRWVAAIVGGIISTGPIYLWYALLKELAQKGMSKGVVATFLYARAIKPFLLPLMVYYFGWKYTVVLTVVMIFFSFVQGFLVEKLTEK